MIKKYSLLTLIVASLAVSLAQAFVLENCWVRTVTVLVHVKGYSHYFYNLKANQSVDVGSAEIEALSVADTQQIPKFALLTNPGFAKNGASNAFSIAAPNKDIQDIAQLLCKAPHATIRFIVDRPNYKLPKIVLPTCEELQSMVASS